MRMTLKKSYDLRNTLNRNDLEKDMNYLSLVKAKLRVEADGWCHVAVIVNCKKTGIVKEMCDILGYG